MPCTAARHSRAALFVQFTSRMKDGVCGQWLCANVPCKTVWDLQPDVGAMVPKPHTWMATFWSESAIIKQELVLEGHRPHNVQSYLNMCAAGRDFLNLCFRGDFNINDDSER